MSMNNALMFNLNANALSLDSTLEGGEGIMLAAAGVEDGDDDT